MLYREHYFFYTCYLSGMCNLKSHVFFVKSNWRVIWDTVLLLYFCMIRCNLDIFVQFIKASLVHTIDMAIISLPLYRASVMLFHNDAKRHEKNGYLFGRSIDIILHTEKNTSTLKLDLFVTEVIYYTSHPYYMFYIYHNHAKRKWFVSMSKLSFLIIIVDLDLLFWFNSLYRYRIIYAHKWQTG